MKKKTPELKSSPERLAYEQIDALNYSSLKELLVSPLHYQHRLKNPLKETKALRIGKMTHEAVLQPSVFKRYEPLPDVDARTTDGKETLKFFYDNLEETDVVVQEDEYSLALNISEAVLTALEQKGIKFKFTEKTCVANYQGIHLKCSIDAVAEQDGKIVLYDIKTCESAASRDFLRQIQQYRYNIQALMYRYIFAEQFNTDLPAFVFIAVEKEPPHAVAFYECGEQLLQDAFLEFQRGIDLYRKCKVTNVWEGFGLETTVIDVPKKPAPINLNFA